MDSLWTSLLVTLAPLVVWLVAVFFSYKQYKEMQKQTEIFKSQVEELQKKPDLKVELDPTFFDSVTPCFNKNSTKFPVEFMNEERNVWYIKLNVLNDGKATAKECLAKVEIIEKETDRVISSMFLTWDLCNRTVMDIPVKDREMVVLMTIIHEYNATNPNVSIYIGMRENGDRPFYNYNYKTSKDYWMYEKNMKLKVAVYCENTTSNPKYYAINLSKLNEVINSKKISELLEEIREKSE